MLLLALSGVFSSKNTGVRKIFNLKGTTHLQKVFSLASFNIFVVVCVEKKGRWFFILLCVCSSVVELIIRIENESLQVHQLFD